MGIFVSSQTQNTPNYNQGLSNQRPCAMQETASSINQQDPLKGAIWALSTLISGSATLGTGILASTVMSLDVAKFSYGNWYSNPYGVQLGLAVTPKTELALTVGTLALGYLTAQCFDQMVAHLGLSHDVRQIEQ
jgi:hypothetical protein